MIQGLSRRFVLFFLIFFQSACTPSVFALARSEKAMAATQHPYATEVALEVLKLGGNAVDAAIAAQWVLNVVEPQSSGIGGGGFFIYYEAATKRIYTFDGREMAPQKAHPDMFLDQNKVPLPFEKANTGGLSAGVPGALKLLKTVHERFGSKYFNFSELFEPAIEIAENGFPITPRLAYFIDQQKERLKFFYSSRQIFLDPDGNPLQAGDMLRQPDLANTFRLIQKEGIKVFYEGEIGNDVVEAVQKSFVNPGLMEKEDLIYYQVFERDPVYGSYRGFDIFSMGPPSSGGTTLIETLNILENFDLAAMGRTADFYHVFAESQKLAFRDRNQYLGDSKFTNVPVTELLSKDRAKKLFEMIQMNTTIPPTSLNPPAENENTSHISIIDPDGNIVSFTTTIEHIFGCAMVVPGRGFFLNNELTDFDMDPRDANGKLRANAPEGGKRPRSSMTPTLVFKEGQPVLAVGSPGGSTIIATVLNVLVNLIDFNMPLDKTLASARLMNRDGATELEPDLYDDTTLVKALENKGEQIVRYSVFGNAQAVQKTYNPPILWGDSDPRGEGIAEGF